MQVSNTTDQGTRYTVASGTTTPPITPPPGTLLTGSLAPGEIKEVHPRGEGPWKVMFMTECGERVVVLARNRYDCVKLNQDQDGFCCEVRASAA